MKIIINYTEVQTFQRDVNIELTENEIKLFRKTGKLPNDIVSKICSETDGLNHVVTECYIDGINQQNKY